MGSQNPPSLLSSNGESSPGGYGQRLRGQSGLLLPPGGNKMALFLFLSVWCQRKPTETECLSKSQRDFPGGTVDKNPLASAEDMYLISGPGESHMPQSN